jgi:hypothetical protein
LIVIGTGVPAVAAAARTVRPAAANKCKSAEGANTLERASNGTAYASWFSEVKFCYNGDIVTSSSASWSEGVTAAGASAEWAFVDRYGYSKSCTTINAYKCSGNTLSENAKFEQCGAECASAWFPKLEWKVTYNGGVQLIGGGVTKTSTVPPPPVECGDECIEGTADVRAPAEPMASGFSSCKNISGPGKVCIGATSNSKGQIVISGYYEYTGSTSITGFLEVAAVGVGRPCSTGSQIASSTIQKLTRDSSVDASHAVMIDSFWSVTFWKDVSGKKTDEGTVCATF